MILLASLETCSGVPAKQLHRLPQHRSDVEEIISVTTNYVFVVFNDQHCISEITKVFKCRDETNRCHVDEVNRWFIKKDVEYALGPTRFELPGGFVAPRHLRVYWVRMR